MLLVIGLLAAAPGRAAAQSSPWQEEERTSAGWTFTPGVALALMWDSGTETASNPLVEALFQSWVAVANPRAELDFNGRRTHFNLGYSGSFEKYWARDAYWEQRGRVGLRQTLSSRFNVSGDAAYSAAPTTDQLEITDSVIPFVEVEARWFNAGGGFTWQAGPRTNVYGNYRFNLLTMDREQAALFTTFGTLRDGHSHAPSLGFMREWTSRLGVGALASYRRDVVATLADDELYDVRSLTAEFSYRWDATTTITFGGGVSQLEEVASGLATTAPAFHAGFSRTLRRLRLGVEYDRGFEQLFGFGSLATTDSISGDALIPLLDQVYFMNVVVAYSKTGQVEDLALGYDFDTLWTNISVGRRLAERLRAEGFVSLAHQGGGAGGSSNRTRVGIQISTSKPMRIE
jgi:hypothetical protein